MCCDRGWRSGWDWTATRRSITRSAWALARAIHATSPRRNHFLLVVDAAPLPSLDHAHGGTVVIDLDPLKRLPARYVATLFEPTRGLRPIFLAREERTLRVHLDTYGSQVTTVALVPLAERPEDVARLLAVHWIEELRTGRRVDELGRGVAANAVHGWPRNLDELHEHSPRLLAYLEHGSLRAAAAALGIKHQTLGAHFQRIGFPVVDRTER